jgi:predicted RNA binding protein YcfA (HicA-like mRNA interferase family)
MPKKVRELKVMLREAGWVVIPGSAKGSHSRWAYPRVARRVTLSGNDGHDAKPGQQRDVDSAVRQAREAH